MTNTIDFTPVLECLISLIISILSIIVIPKLKAWLDTRLSASQIGIAKIIIDSAVKAAEQIYAQSEKSGSSKKKFVIEYVQDKLQSLGMSIDIHEIEVYLEQAVLELKMNVENVDIESLKEV